MATQSTTYNTDGSTRTFPSTKPIPTISHVGVYLKRVSDNAWVQMNVGDYTLVQNSIIMDNAPDTLIYSQLEVRVADDPAEITTSPSNVAIVAGDTTAINTVATNINAVINNSTNMGAVTNVSANIASVNTVSADIVKVRTVADNITSVNAVSTNMANVNAVGADLLEPISEINTVATDIANVNVVGAAISNVNTVATSITNVNSVATTVVPNIAEILLADDNATIATNKAVEASNSAIAALSYLNDFKGRCYGALASDPTLDPLGAAISAGDLYFNTTLVPPRFRTYSGVVWQDAFTGDASGVANTPSGLISATNVQNAINELDTEKANSGYTNYRNRIINGAMNVNQINGTTAVTPTANWYVSDQWISGITQASKLTFQQVVDAPSGFKYSTKITVASQYAPLATDAFAIYQPVEGQNIIDFKLGTAGAVKLSTNNWIKGSVAGTYTVSIRNGAFDRSYVGTINVTTSWTKVEITLVGDTSGVWATDNTRGLSWALDLGSGSNYNTTEGTWQAGNFLRTAGSVTFVNQVAGSTLNITGVQLEKVPTGATEGTEYEWLSYEEELRRCMWYVRPLPQYISGQVFSTTTSGHSLLRHPMRTAPSLSTTVGFSVTGTGGGAISASAVSISGAAFTNSSYITATGASGLVAGQASLLICPAGSLLLAQL